MGKRARGVPAKANGRPTVRTPEIVDEILTDIAKGTPMAQICRRPHMPARENVWRWATADTDFGAALAKARLEGFDVIAEETMEIADDARNDWMDSDEDGKGKRFNAEHVQRSKLRIETRLKLLAKWDPKRYGEFQRTEISGPDGGPIAMANLSDEQLRARAVELAAKLGVGNV